MSKPSTAKSYTPENAKEHLRSLLTLMNIDKVYFVDDSHQQEHELEEFIVLIGEIFKKGILYEIKEELTFIDLESHDDEDFLKDSIKNQWDSLTHSQKTKCFKVIYKKLDSNEATNLNVSPDLEKYFDNGVLELFSPTQWESFFNLLTPDFEKKILVLFDQDLSREEGKYTTLKGQDLILNIKKNNYRKFIYPALFTFTIDSLDKEIEERNNILQKFQIQGEDVTSEDFFVFTKDRLNYPNLLADAVKKLFLSEYCERLKNQTTTLAEQAFKDTINALENLDTYSFEAAILKSSYKEGVWEIETLLRVINIYFEDFIKEQMIKSNYLLNTNEDLIKAHQVSNQVNITTANEVMTSPYLKPIQLRAKEIYEAGQIINNLHKPIENGDIFELSFDDNSKGLYLLVAQECDLMIRNVGKKEGNRTSNSGVLLKIDIVTKDFKVKNDNHKLEYFGTSNCELAEIKFTESLNIDLSIFDLVVFNTNGTAKLDLSKKYNRKNYLSSSLKQRFSILYDKFKTHNIDTYQLLKKLGISSRSKNGKLILNKVAQKAVIIGKQQVKNLSTIKCIEYQIKRVSRLRNPYARIVLEKYMRHLSRIAEQHDFAKEK